MNVQPVQTHVYILETTQIIRISFLKNKPQNHRVKYFVGECMFKKEIGTLYIKSKLQSSSQR